MRFLDHLPGAHRSDRPLPFSLDRLRTAVNVRDFRGVGDGVTDDTRAIQNAIDSLPLSGGDVLFQSGTYRITSTINIGDGTSSAVSTRYGVRLIGIGAPLLPVGFAGYPTTPAVKLQWSGPAGGTMIKIAGPLIGWGLHNILLDGASSADRGLNVISGQYGDCRNLAAINCQKWGLYSEVVAPFGGVTFTGANHNRYDNTTIFVPSGAVGGGIILTGTATMNTLFNLFTNTTVAIAGTTQNGIYLQAAAGNAFYMTHITGAPGVTSIVFDYSLAGGWPANNTIDTIEPATTGSTWATNSGAPAGAKPNYLRNLITTDGATYPTLANLVTDGGQVFATQTNDAASAGNVGEFVSATVVQGSAVALTTSVAANVTSISLTAGDWDVWFESYFNPAGTTSITLSQSSVSIVSATMNTAPGNFAAYATAAQVPANDYTLPAGPTRLSLSATTTVFGVALSIFTVSTNKAYGILRARRVR